MKKKVVVGMSGGVDSSVAALLLKEQGYDVIGVTMQMWQEQKETQEENGGCCGFSAAEDAARVAGQLDIPHYVINFEREFKEQVIDYFAEEYLQGRTPNPCIVCNRSVKWEALLQRSLAMGADYIATGHYARIDKLSNGRYAVRNSVTASKDQTYALYNLTQEQLARTLMPIGGYTKEEIRQMAEQAGLFVAGKPDSQDICFVPDGDYAAFVERKAGGRTPRPGNFVDLDGNVLGRHQGITHYTIGQRKGLGIALGRRAFVCRIRLETNEVVIGENEDTFTREILCNKVNYMAVAGLTGPERVMAKIRYSHQGAACTIEEREDGTVACLFDEPVRASTPGQAIVFYRGEYVLGGGTIL